MDELQKVEAEIEDVLSAACSVIELVAEQKPIVSTFYQKKIKNIKK